MFPLLLRACCMSKKYCPFLCSEYEYEMNKTPCTYSIYSPLVYKIKYNCKSWSGYQTVGGRRELLFSALEPKKNMIQVQPPKYFKLKSGSGSLAQKNVGSATLLKSVTLTARGPKITSFGSKITIVFLIY